MRSMVEGARQRQPEAIALAMTAAAIPPVGCGAAGPLPRLAGLGGGGKAPPPSSSTRVSESRLLVVSSIVAARSSGRGQQERAARGVLTQRQKVWSKCSLGSKRESARP